MAMPSIFLRCVATTMLLALLALAPRAAEAFDPSYSGSWYRPEESGSGFNLEIISDERALLFWYTYDDNGQAVWLYSEGVVNGETIDFNVYYADGMRFSDLDAADKNNRPWGTLQMRFLGCNNAEITYQSTLTGEDHSPVGTRTFPVQRLVNIASLPCRSRIAGYWEGRHWDPTLNDGLGAWSDLKGVTTQYGGVFFTSVASNELFVGSFISNTQIFQIGYDVCDLDGDGCNQGSGQGAYGRKDFLRGTSTSDEHGTQKFELTYRTLYDRTVSLASIAGDWSFEDGADSYTVTVLADGSVDVAGSNGCTATGELTQADEEFNVFDFEGTSSCHDYSLYGVVVNADVESGDRKALEFRLMTAGGTDFQEPFFFVATRP